MKERVLSLWSPKPEGAAIALPTSGYVKKDGKAVMSQGVLAQARHQFKGIDARLGKKLLGQGRLPGNKDINLGIGNHVTPVWLAPPIFSFPVKWNWWEDADIQLIERSARELVELIESVNIKRVYLPPIQDGLPYQEVRDILDRYLDHRFIVCHEVPKNA